MGFWNLKACFHWYTSSKKVTPTPTRSQLLILLILLKIVPLSGDNEFKYMNLWEPILFTWPQPQISLKSAACRRWKSERCHSVFFRYCSKILTKTSQVRKGYICLTGDSLSLIEAKAGTGSRNQRKGTQLKSLFALGCLSSFLIQVTCLGMTLHIVGWGLLHQLAVNRVSCRYGHRPILSRKFFSIYSLDPGDSRFVLCWQLKLWHVETTLAWIKYFPGLTNGQWS